LKYRCRIEEWLDDASCLQAGKGETTAAAENNFIGVLVLWRSSLLDLFTITVPQQLAPQGGS